MMRHIGFLGVGLALLTAACAPADNDTEEINPAETTPAMEPVSEVLTEAAQAALTPDQVLEQLKEGNQRFVEGRLTPRDYNAQAAATATGQYPKAAILGCVDSRVPPEIIFDQGIGDLFVGRVAGNFENEDLLGSLEFATAVSGTPLIVVLGHTSCGAIKGAVAGVELGNLTAMLDNFDEVLAQVREIQALGTVDPEEAALIEAAIVENVRRTMADILESSEAISGLVESGDLGVVGGVYDLATGQIEWLES
jgi:carbonic anhydrase